MYIVRLHLVMGMFISICFLEYMRVHACCVGTCTLGMGSRKVKNTGLELEVGLESKEQHSGGFWLWIILTIF